MLQSSVERILRSLSDGDVVLDIGGWARPFPRADWVMDLMPYETRGRYGRDGPGPERFSADSWIQRDICDRETYPFKDGEVDFVICSHTLEDVRDPVWVCSEMSRIARAGYVEVPSRLEEQTYGFAGPHAGWGHHRWLADVEAGRMRFVVKNHRVALEGNHFPPEFRAGLSESERVQTMFWEGTLTAAERVYESAEQLDAYLSEPVREQRAALDGGREGLGRRIRRAFSGSAAARL